MNRPVALLVLGMHRSGTSAVAGALSALGVPMGGPMVGAAADNPMGYWEHAVAVQAHERLLHDLGRGWEDLRPLPERWLDSEVAAAAERTLDALIEQDFRDRPLWALKDPRMCRLLPLWQRLLQRRGIEPRYLHMLRAPDEVASSLHKRDGIALQHGRLLWAVHVLDSVRDSAATGRVLLRYDDLLLRPAESLQAAGSALGIAWPQPLDGQAGLADALRPDLRHHRGGAAGGDDPVAHLYADCLRLAAGEGDWAALLTHAPAIEGLVAEALPWMAGLGEALCRSRRQQVATASRLAETEAALEEARTLSLQRMHELAGRDDRLNEVHAALDQVTRLSLERLAALEVEARRLDEVHAALDSVKQLSLERLGQIDELHTALEEAQRLSVERLAQIEAKDRALETLHQFEHRLAELQQMHATALGELAATTALSEQRAGQLQAMLASRSWRYTRPLRALLAGMRRWLARA